MERRQFVKSSAAITALSFLPNLSIAAPSQPVGLQLYTVRDEMKKNVGMTLETVAKIGYTHLEGAGYENRNFYGMPPKDFKKLLTELGLKMVSSHSLSPFLKNNADATFEDAAEAGAEYVVLAWLFPEERKSIEDYKIIIELLNISYERAKKHGLSLAYHNHDFEFIPLEGQVPYELMMRYLPADMPMELDLYWVNKAGLDPVDLFNKYPNRFPLWHVKDMDNSPEKSFTEVGNGTIDFQRLFNESKTTGLKYFFVEQDQTKRTPFESIEISYKNVQKIKS